MGCLDNEDGSSSERIHILSGETRRKKAMNIELGHKQICTLNFWRAIAAEFFGMTLFLLIVTTVALPQGNDGGNVSSNNVEIGLGIGLAISSLAIMIGHVSGGHLNPAVTVGMICGGRISIIQGLFYIVAQTIGGVVGTALTYACTTIDMRNMNNLGQTNLADGLKVEQGFGLELLFTFILVFLVFSITDPVNKVEKYAVCLGIGIVILVCHVCLIPFTGCGINPARSFGPAVVMNKWDNHWVYWVGPIIGGILAPFIYNFIFYAEEPKPSENGDIQMTKQEVSA